MRRQPIICPYFTVLITRIVCVLALTQQARAVDFTLGEEIDASVNLTLGYAKLVSHGRFGSIRLVGFNSDLQRQSRRHALWGV